MRICILGGFHDVPIRNLTLYLVQQGFEVHLLCFGPPDTPPSVRGQSIGMRGKAGWLSAWPRIRRIVDEINPDVVHATYLTSYGFLASTLPPSVPVVVTGRGSDVFGAPQHARWLRPLRQELVRRTLRRAYVIHSVAEHMTIRLQELGASRARIVTMSWGIAVDQFQHSTRLHPPAPPYQLLCNRHLEPVYDHRTLLESAGILRQSCVDFRLRILGDGYLKPALQRRAVELGLSSTVTFEPRVSHARMPEVLQSADLFISASHSHGTAASLLESLAVGCVPIVTKIPANLPWVVDSETGFLFEPGQPASLAAAIRRAFAAVDDWPRMRAKNRERVARDASFSESHRKLIDTYRQLAGKRRIRPRHVAHFEACVHPEGTTAADPKRDSPQVGVPP